MLIFEHRLGNT